MDTGERYRTAREELELVVAETNEQQQIFNICADAQKIGWAALRVDPYRNAEINFFLQEESRGNGNATLAVRTLAILAINNLDYPLVYASVSQQETAFGKVLERAGFDHVTAKEENYYFLTQQELSDSSDQDRSQQAPLMETEETKKETIDSNLPEEILSFEQTIIATDQEGEPLILEPSRSGTYARCKLCPRSIKAKRPHLEIIKPREAEAIQGKVHRKCAREKLLPTLVDVRLLSNDQ